MRVCDCPVCFSDPHFGVCDCSECSFDCSDSSLTVLQYSLTDIWTQVGAWTGGGGREGCGGAPERRTVMCASVTVLSASVTLRLASVTVLSASVTSLSVLRYGRRWMPGREEGDARGAEVVSFCDRLVCFCDPFLAYVTARSIL